jgi:hypothetical protein
MSNQIQDLTVRNLVVTGNLTLPKNSIDGDIIKDGAGIGAAKIVHRRSLDYQQANGAAIADATVPVVIARGTTGTIIAIEVAILTAAAGDSTVTIDLQKSTGGGAFASVLSAPIAINSSTVVRTPVVGVLSATSFTDGDVLLLVVDATVGTGTLPQGLIVTATVDETPV